MKTDTIVQDAQSPRLSEKQVRDRVSRITDITVINEVYSLGQSIGGEIIDSIRVIESKSTLFAAYGTGIVGLLVSSSATWSSLGNQITSWIIVCIGLAALVCTAFAVKSLTLKTYKVISQDEWLEDSCLQSELRIKRYHVLASWSTMDSRLQVQIKKLKELQAAQQWLTVSVASMVFLLFQIAFLRNYRLAQASSGGSISKVLGVQAWQILNRHDGALGSLACALIGAVIMSMVFRYNWLSRFFGVFSHRVSE